MKKYEVLVIDQFKTIMVFSGLLLFLVFSIVALINADVMSIYSLVTVLILIVLLYVYFKRYFTYSISLELYADRLKISKHNKEEEILFSEIKNYKIEILDGVRLEIHLQNGDKKTFITSNTFGSTPEILDSFCNHYEELIKQYQEQNYLEYGIIRKRGFLETKFALYFIISLSVIGFGGIIISFFLKRELSIHMLVIAVPIIILLEGLRNSRSRRDN